jgi:ABC-2 type transport system permease protein
MSLRRSLAIARHEVRVLLSDWTSLLTLILMPLVMMAFLKPVARLALSDQYGDANGAEFAVPGMTVLFAFFLVSFVGFLFFSEHRQNTWERLRASPARNSEIMLGKTLPAFGLCLFQQTVLFALGFALFGLRIPGSLLGVAAIVVAFAVCLTTFGLLLAAVLRTEQQLNLIGNLGAMLLAGLSGALVPITVLPQWARMIAPVAPQYWAMRGFRSLILEAEGLGAAAVPVAVLLGLAVVFGTAALMRFRFDEPKVVTVRA